MDLLHGVSTVEEGKVIGVKALHTHAHSVEGEKRKSLGIARGDVVRVTLDGDFPALRYGVEAVYSLGNDG
jgi:hypothetical protein